MFRVQCKQINIHNILLFYHIFFASWKVLHICFEQQLKLHQSKSTLTAPFDIFNQKNNNNIHVAKVFVVWQIIDVATTNQKHIYVLTTPRGIHYQGTEHTSKHVCVPQWKTTFLSLIKSGANLHNVCWGSFVKSFILNFLFPSPFFYQFLLIYLMLMLISVHRNLAYLLLIYVFLAFYFGFFVRFSYFFFVPVLVSSCYFFLFFVSKLKSEIILHRDTTCLDVLYTAFANIAFCI